MHEHALRPLASVDLYFHALLKADDVGRFWHMFVPYLKTRLFADFQLNDIPEAPWL